MTSRLTEDMRIGAVAGALGVPFERARRALASYAGMARRFHLRGQRGGVTVVDDYAHHPTKLAATLATAKLGDWRRVVAVFQPLPDRCGPADRHRRLPGRQRGP